MMKRKVNVLVPHSMAGNQCVDNGKVREQSQSIVRGEHPIAFMLPTVSLSDVGSETEVQLFFLFD